MNSSINAKYPEIMFAVKNVPQYNGKNTHEYIDQVKVLTETLLDVIGKQEAEIIMLRAILTAKGRANDANQTH